MPLYIKSTDHDYNDDRPYYMNDGDVRPPVASILSVEADGYELNCIMEYFANIPHHKMKNEQTWYGDFAKFIVANL